MPTTSAMCCRSWSRQNERAGRHASTIGERLGADIAAFRDLPAVPLEPCEKRSARVSSTGLVRYRGNDYYSVPTAHGLQDVIVKEFVDEVVILFGGDEIAGISAATARAPSSSIRCITWRCSR